MSTTKPENDRAEAVELLSRVSSEFNDNAAEEVAAHKRVIDQLVELSGCVPGVHVEASGRAPSQAAAMFLFSHRDENGRRVVVRWAAQRRCQVVQSLQAEGNEIDQPTPTATVFDASLGEFRGTELDEYATPIPGEPRPWRSAVTVIVEAACKKLGIASPRRG
jgi:hypothetical protein